MIKLLSRFLTLHSSLVMSKFANIFILNTNENQTLQLNLSTYVSAR